MNLKIDDSKVGNIQVGSKSDIRDKLKIELFGINKKEKGNFFFMNKESTEIIKRLEEKIDSGEYDEYLAQFPIENVAKTLWDSAKIGYE